MFLFDSYPPSGISRTSLNSTECHAFVLPEHAQALPSTEPLHSFLLPHSMLHCTLVSLSNSFKDLGLEDPGKEVGNGPTL